MESENYRCAAQGVSDAERSGGAPQRSRVVGHGECRAGRASRL